MVVANKLKYKNLLNGGYLFVVLAVFLFGGYFFYQLRNFLVGPKISIVNLEEYGATNDPFFEIKGKAKNVSNLNLNGRKIFTDRNGYFKENLLLAPGTNFLQLKAEDKFGRELTKQYHIFFQIFVSEAN